MLINILIFYFLSYIINYKYLLLYFSTAYILNKYNTKFKSVIFYICIPYNSLLILITFIKYRLCKYRYCKKYFRFERKIRNYFQIIKKNTKLYIRRKIMNYRIYITTKRISNPNS
jgi:hypothetical protein